MNSTGFEYASLIGRGKCGIVHSGFCKRGKTFDHLNGCQIPKKNMRLEDGGTCVLLVQRITHDCTF